MKDLCSRYRFHSLPFTRETRADQRFQLPFIDEAQDDLQKTLERRMSCALIAPAGTGKTTLLRGLLASLPEARYRVTYIKVAGLSRRDMCREIAVGLGLRPAGTYPSLIRAIQERLLSSLDGDSQRPVLIFDDAHEFRPEVLGMLKVLTNFDMDSRLVVAVLLVGQAPLRRLLAREELEDVARRLAHYASLRTLSREETYKYLEHRCADAGATDVPFATEAVDAIYEIGRGNLRATDQLALKSLEIAHNADRDVVDAHQVIAARKVLWP